MDLWMVDYLVVQLVADVVEQLVNLLADLTAA
jgi:hypothetical protein